MVLASRNFRVWNVDADRSNESRDARRDIDFRDLEINHVKGFGVDPGSTERLKPQLEVDRGIASFAGLKHFYARSTGDSSGVSFKMLRWKSRLLFSNENCVCRGSEYCPLSASNIDPGSLLQFEMDPGAYCISGGVNVGRRSGVKSRADPHTAKVARLTRN
jgi:hypothetical protein